LQRLVEPHDLRMLLRHALSHVFVFFFCRRERLTSYIQLRGAGSQYLYFCTSKTSTPRTSIAARASVSSRWVVGGCVSICTFVPVKRVNWVNWVPELWQQQALESRSAAAGD
jgi:hypothetical protein